MRANPAWNSSNEIQMSTSLMSLPQFLYYRMNIENEKYLCIQRAVQWYKTENACPNWYDIVLAGRG